MADYLWDWARNSYAWTQSEYMVTPRPTAPGGVGARRASPQDCYPAGSGQPLNQLCPCPQVNYWFTPKVGVLPALLLSLRVLGERLVAMERSSPFDEITLVGGSVERQRGTDPRPASPRKPLSSGPALRGARPC